jgi:hypothetical protein
MNIVTINMLWIILSITFGILWDRLKPHETTQFKTVKIIFLYFLLKNIKFHNLVSYNIHLLTGKNC